MSDQTIKTNLLDLCAEFDDLSDDEVLERIGEIYDFWFLPWGGGS